MLGVASRLGPPKSWGYLNERKKYMWPIRIPTSSTIPSPKIQPMRISYEISLKSNSRQSNLKTEKEKRERLHDWLKSQSDMCEQGFVKGDKTDWLTDWLTEWLTDWQAFWTALKQFFWLRFSITWDSLYKIKLSTIFRKASPRWCFWNFLDHSPTWPESETLMILQMQAKVHGLGNFGVSTLTYPIFS